jgi:hypothetical protein
MAQSDLLESEDQSVNVLILVLELHKLLVSPDNGYSEGSRIDLERLLAQVCAAR